MTSSTPDLVEIQKTRNLVTDELAQVAVVYPKGTPEYYKASLNMVFRMVKVGDWEGSLQIVKSIPKDYYQNIMPKQMADDNAFAALVVHIADSYLARGIAQAPIYYIPAKTFLQQSADA